MQKLKPEQLLLLRAYNPAEIPKPDTVVFRIEQKNVGSIGNFIIISGLPKRGKGKFTAAVMASALTGNPVWGMHCFLPEDKRKVAFFDTDQSRYDFYKNIDLIKDLAGANDLPPTLHAYNVRRDEPGDICNMIEIFTRQHPDCGMIVIDNIGDLLNNFNDEGQSKKLINYLKRVTDEKNIFIVCTLHQGKSNNSTIGHLGAMSDRYAQTILTCEKIENNYLLKIKDSRTCGDITPITIYYDEHSNQWQETAYIPEADDKVKPLKPKPRELDPDLHTRNTRRIFNHDEIISYGDLVEAIKETYAAGTNWAKECVIYLQDQLLIFKIPGGYTRRKQKQLYAE